MTELAVTRKGSRIIEHVTRPTRYEIECAIHDMQDVERLRYLPDGHEIRFTRSCIMVTHPDFIERVSV